MKWVSGVQWLIRVTAFLIVLGAPAIVHGGYRPAGASRTDCARCENTPPTIPEAPVSLPVRASNLAIQGSLIEAASSPCTC